jgi:hypothetical protein
MQKMENYNAFEVTFTSKDQTFVFMIGNTKAPFPMSIRHQFSVREHCHFCGRLIFPPPMGHQLCTVLQDNMEAIFLQIKGQLPK